jgi:hypothetical protein
MHVTVVGAGVLGRVYGVRLAQAGADVSFVVRPSRAAETSPFLIEQVNGGHRHDALDHPRRLAAIDERSDVVLVTLRYNQLDPGAGGDLVALLRKTGSSSAPIIILTPMMPAQREALEQAAGRRVVPSLPGVVGYLNDKDVVRYWVPAATSTLLDDLPASDIGEAARASLEAIARRLTQIDLPTRFERDVASQNAATTTSFFPLIASIDAGGGIDGVLGDKDLLGAVLDAAKESDALARKLGKTATFAHVLMKFVGPFTLKPGVALGRKLFPEAVEFVERHFGAKLHDQHVAMGETILALGRDHGMSMPALTKLVDILRSRPPSA